MDYTQIVGPSNHAPRDSLALADEEPHGQLEDLPRRYLTFPVSTSPTLRNCIRPFEQHRGSDAANPPRQRTTLSDQKLALVRDPARRHRLDLQLTASHQA